jgi:hypothetical protein
VKGPSIAAEWYDKSLLRFEAKHVCRIGDIENLTANTAGHKEDERDGLLEQNASLKLKRLHFELGYKRLSSGRFGWWPGMGEEKMRELAVHELQLLLWNGNPAASTVGDMWKKITLSVNKAGHT